MNNKIWLSSPHMGGTEQSFINKAFSDNWVAPVGPDILGFEEDLASYTRVNYVVGLTSGTAAIHLGLLSLGVTRDDEVLCQSLTFVATANPILYLGATPVFIDSEKDTWNMDPEALEEAIKDRLGKGKTVKAIIVVHLYGMPAKIERIVAIAEQYGIPVLEDAAEALGSKVGDRMAGSFGKVAALSFNGNKIITTSGGGAFLTNSKKRADKARFLSTQAKENEIYYQHKELGYNYRMSNISACIGRGQMEVLDKHIANRRANFQFYKEHLSSVPGISFQEELKDSFSNRWLTTILMDSNLISTTKNDIIIEMNLTNVECRPVWKPMHLQPLFKECAYYGNKVAEYLFDNGLCLPSGSNLIEQDLNRVLSVLFNTLENIDCHKTQVIV